MKTSLYLIFLIAALTACNNSNNSQAKSISKTRVNDTLNTILNEYDCDYRFVVKAIDQADFEKLYAHYYKEHKPTEITDYYTAKEMLGNVVEWMEEQGEDENGEPTIYGHPLKINFRNGKTVDMIDEENLRIINESGWIEASDYATFVSYFPHEDILYLYQEGGGDTGDLSYILETGDSTEVAGDPRETYYPPINKNHRIRGYFNGYASVFHYQQKQGDHYVNLCPLWERTADYDVFASMQKVFFTNDTTFYFEHEGHYNAIHHKEAKIINNIRRDMEL